MFRFCVGFFIGAVSFFSSALFKTPTRSRHPRAMRITLASNRFSIIVASLAIAASTHPVS
jgi:hypothetical protein